MTLAQRLLLATALLTIAATTTVGYGVREAWRRTEERRFQAEFRAALEPLGRELERQLRDLPLLLGPLCAHDPLVDSALIGVKASDLESRRLSLSLRVPELSKALGTDELWLLTHTGEVLGAHAAALVGQRMPEIASRVARQGALAELRTSEPRAVLAACLRRDSSDPQTWVGLLAARKLEPLLERIGPAYGVTLSLDAAEESQLGMQQRIAIPEVAGLAITARRSRVPLREALRELDATILLIGGGTVLLALLAAVLLSRGLARPMVELARQAREAMLGEPRHIVMHGPREVEESAAAFNRALDDLIALRRRLIATERIAAWREIARSVAHEIKNPLAPIRAAIETLRRLRSRNDPAFDDYFDEATRTALAEVNRINHIVTEFTEFARLPAPKPAPIDLVEVARTVVSLHAAGAPGVRLRHEPSPLVLADRGQMIQVLTNLIQNGIDAASGQAEPSVVVDVRPRDELNVSVSVADNGPGVAPDVRERLFLPYATTKPHGTGLGLAIAQRLVVEHGGHIGYRQGAEGGAEFFFELPMVSNGRITSVEPVSEAAP